MRISNSKNQRRIRLNILGLFLATSIGYILLYIVLRHPGGRLVPGLSELIRVILVLMVFWLIGALVSLLVLLPPLRKLGRTSAMTRKVKILLFVFLAFALGFVLTRWWDALDAYATIGYIHYPDVRWHGDKISSNAIVGELLIRGLIPSPLRRSCYSSKAAVCNWANKSIEGWEYKKHMSLTMQGFDPSYVSARSKWSNWWKHPNWWFWLSFAPALASGVCVWFFTQQGKERDSDTVV